MNHVSRRGWASVGVVLVEAGPGPWVRRVRRGAATTRSVGCRWTARSHPPLQLSPPTVHKSNLRPGHCHPHPRPSPNARALTFILIRVPIMPQSTLTNTTRRCVSSRMKAREKSRRWMPLLIWAGLA